MLSQITTALSNYYKFWQLLTNYDNALLQITVVLQITTLLQITS